MSVIKFGDSEHKGTKIRKFCSEELYQHQINDFIIELLGYDSFKRKMKLWVNYL